MPSTTEFEFGDVLLVPFPFTDQRTTKRRPAVVVSSAVYNRDKPDLIVNKEVNATLSIARIRSRQPPDVQRDGATI